MLCFLNYNAKYTIYVILLEHCGREMVFNKKVNTISWMTPTSGV